MNRSSGTLDYQLIASWLGLPAGPWPPDHYALLGLPPGEADEARIEQQVHERLMRVRSYQLSFPEMATEAMKRIAQAFDCLTNAPAKKAYDTAHFPELSRPASAARVRTAIAHDTAETTPLPKAPTVPAPPPAPAAHDAAAWWAKQEMVWKPDVTPPPVRPPKESVALPPPVRAPKESVALPPPVRVPVANVEPPPLLPSAPDLPINEAAPTGPPPAPLVPAKVPTAKPVEPGFEVDKSSPALRQGLGTRRSIYERAVWLRQLWTAWERAGKHVSRPKKRLTRTADEGDLTRQLETIEDLLQEQPSLLGQPGQPGYRVIALANHESFAAAFNALDEEQRDLLARDWIAGRVLLRAHRKFLCQQVKKLRRATALQRLGRTIDATLTDFRGWVLLALALVALLVLAGVYFL